MVVRAICYLFFSILFKALALRARAIKKISKNKSHIALNHVLTSTYFVVAQYDTVPLPRKTSIKNKGPLPRIIETENKINKKLRMVPKLL